MLGPTMLEAIMLGATMLVATMLGATMLRATMPIRPNFNFSDPFPSVTASRRTYVLNTKPCLRGRDTEYDAGV
ncbi:hypothetical protein EYF80_012462 [Liparis tanakae]|uniref:Uncharacterized protein n=1 Tax=Liparis tanakae TaxID=230148 RepID=A0A4Z2IHN2_9TELE|nr:hypothetical protein EYF80_012462 [Liparis tanakae]